MSYCKKKNPPRFIITGLKEKYFTKMAANTGFNNIPRGNADKESWQMRKSVLNCNKYMLEKEIACDVTFTFLSSNGIDTQHVSQTPLSCHKYMLISRSPVFYAMLEGPARDESGNINITDVDKDTFNEMLR